MRKTRKCLINLILLVSSLLFSLAIFDTSLKSEGKIPSTNKQIHLEYTTHEPIKITSDENFTDYGFAGEGTEINPFIIEDLYIDATGIWNTIGISIKFVYVSFIIRNCLIENAGTAIYLYGIYLNSCRIEHNIINNASQGIYMEYVHNGTFLDNTIEADYAGIYVESGGYVALINNTISNTYNAGIYVDDEAMVITGNKFYNSGLLLSMIVLEYLDSFTIDDNTANDKPIVFYNDVDLVNIDDTDNFGQIFLYSCNEVNIASQDLSNTSIGIQAYLCENMTISDCNFWYNQRYGINLFRNSLLNIYNCDFRYNTYGESIKLYDCDNTDISNTNFEEVYALQIEASDNVHIMGNDFIDVSHVMYATYCFYLTFNENWVIGKPSGWGIHCYWGDFLDIYDNIFYRCYMSVHFVKIRNGTIYHNLFQENSNAAIELESEVENCTIYHNTFVDNDIYGYNVYEQVYDNGTNSKWYNETLQEGNYWDDWVSGPYDIYGPAGSQDLYPLANPTVIPFIPELNKKIAFSFIFIPLVICIPYIVKRKKKRN